MRTAKVPASAGKKAAGRAVKLKSEVPPKRNGRGRPKSLGEADDGANRKRILDAALRTFSVHGFEGASIADMARLHQVSPALIHYYFENKDALWRAALDHGIGDVIRDLTDTMADLTEFDSVSRLKFFIRRYIAMISERPEVFGVIIRESESPGERLTWLTQRHLNALYGLWTKLVEAAQGEGKINAEVPAYHLSQIIAGASYQFIASRNRMLEAYGIDVLAKEERDRHCSAVIEIVFNGMLIKKPEEESCRE